MLKQLAQAGFHFDDESSLIQQISQGDQKAWEAVVKTLYPALLNFVFGMVKDRETAEELVQDVFVNFWVKRETLHITSSLKAYLYRAARNHTLNFIKRRKFEIDYQKSLAQSLEISRNDTEETYRFTELERKLGEAIEALPDNCREIFKMSRFEELTYKEISEALDIPVRTVHYQIGLALKELRHKLQGYASIPLLGLSSILIVGLLSWLIL